MNTLIFAKTPNGSYAIADNNDERLIIIAQVLLNNMVRSQIKSKLLHLPGLVVGETLAATVDTTTIRIRQHEDDMLMINLSDRQTKQELTTEISNDMLLDLIDDWEDLLVEQPDEIILRRQHDQDIFILTGKL
jgi:hypothetical protein